MVPNEHTEQRLPPQVLQLASQLAPSCPQAVSFASFLMVGVRLYMLSYLRCNLGSSLCGDVFIYGVLLMDLSVYKVPAAC